MKKLLLALLLTATSSIAMANNPPQAEGLAPRTIILPETEIAKEYRELGKLYNLNPDLAETVIQINIDMADNCGLTMSWQTLFNDSRFRNYVSLTRNEPDSNPDVRVTLIESLCRTLQK
ncbi:hypothetical protein NTE14_005041 [Vibrio harveyi]|nr:hypothetical protein [Vibrio harveyi]